MKSKFLAISVILAASVLSIAYFSTKGEASFLLLDASELAVNPAKYSGENLRVRGNVKIGSVLREGREARFVLELNGKEVPVHFTGKSLLPDAFKDGVRARVDGHFKSGTLEADHVEAKCASKYEADYSK